MKLKAFWCAPKYKLGYQIPCYFEEALKSDEINCNIKWADMTKLEMLQLNDYECFIDAGIYNHDPIPDGYRKKWVHLVYFIKHDGRHKAHLTLTDVPAKSVYSGVVLLHGIWKATFLAELNGMDLFSTDIGNAYVKAYITNETGGSKFEEMEGQILIIAKALYRLQTSRLIGMTTSQNDLPYRDHAIQGQAWHLDASNMMATSMSILQCMWMTLQ